MEINQYNSDTMEIKYTNKTKTIVGIFNLGAKPRPTKLQYAGINQITGEPIKRGTQVISEPIIVVI